MGRFSLRVWIPLGTLLLAGILLTVALVRLESHPSPWWGTRLSWAVNRLWAEEQGLRVDVGEVGGRPLGRLLLTGVRIDGGSTGLEVRADTVYVDLALAKTLLAAPAVKDLEVAGLTVRLPDSWTSAPPKEEKEGKAVEIRRLLVRRGSIGGGKLGGTTVEIPDFEGFLRWGRERLAVRLDRASVRVSGPDLELVSLTGWFTRSEGTLRPKLALETRRSSITVQGEVDVTERSPSDLKVGLDALDLDDVAAAVSGWPAWARGRVSGAVYVSGSRKRWETRLNLEAGIADFPEARVRAHVTATGDSLTVPEITVSTDAGSLEGRGLTLVLDERSYSGVLDVRGLDLDAWNEDVAGPALVSGRADLAGRGLTFPPETAVLGVELDGCQYGSWRVEGGSLRVVWDGARLAVEGLDLRGPGWSTRGEGQWSGPEGLAATAECTVDSLGPLGRTFGQDLAGRGTLRLAASGRIHDLSGRGAFDAFDLRSGDATLDSLFGDVDFRREKGPLRATCFAQGRGFRRGSLRSQKVTANVEIAGRDVESFQATAQVDSLLLHAEGAMAARGAVRTVTLERADISSAERLWENQGPVRLVFGPAGFRLEPSLWRSDGSTLEAEVESARKGDIVLRVAGTDVRLGALADVLRPGLRIDGTGNLEVRVEGRRDDPRAFLAFDAHPLVFGETTLERVVGAAKVEGGWLDLDSLALFQGQARAGLAGRVPVAFSLGGEGGAAFGLLGPGDLRLDVSRFPLDVFLHGDPPVAGGTVDLTARFSGETGEPAGEISGSIEGARLRQFDLGRVDFRGSVNERTLEVEEARATGGGGEGCLTGLVPLASRESFPWLVPEGDGMSLHVTATGARFGFLPLLNSAIFRASDGRFDLDLALTGSLADPELGGTMKIRGGTLTIGDLEEPIEALAADVVFKDHRIEIESARGRLGGGELTAGVEVSLDSLRAVGYEVDVRTRESEIASLLDDVTGVVSVDLTVRPDTTDFGTVVPRYTGRVEVVEAEIRRDLTMSGGPGGSPLAPTVAPTWTADLALEAANNVWLRNSDMEIELEGSVRLKMGSEGMTFLGDLETIRGRYFLYGHEFRITTGTLKFTDVRDPKNAELNILAETEVRTDEGGETVFLEITGTFAKPYLAATSESGYSEPEIFRLLALGQEAGGTEGGTATPFSRALARSWGQILARRFGAELARSLGLDELEFEPGPDRDLVEGARVGVGKYVSDRLYLKYKQTLAVNSLGETTSGATTRAESELPDRQLLLEYRLSRSFSLDGEASVLNGTPYFNFDVKFRHRY